MIVRSSLNKNSVALFSATEVFELDDKDFKLNDERRKNYFEERSEAGTTIEAGSTGRP